MIELDWLLYFLFFVIGCTAGALLFIGWKGPSE